MSKPTKPLTDDETSRAYEAELEKCATDTAVDVPEYEGIDTRDADVNYDTRSNIVRP